MDFDSKKAGSWLGLTPQQFNVFEIVYRIQKRGLTASPKSIQKEYSIVHGGRIQKPNLFNILRLLLDKGFLVKRERGSYTVDSSSVSEYLEGQVNCFENELYGFRDFLGDFTEYLDQLSSKKSSVMVDYLGFSELFNTLGRKLKSANTLYVTSKFPMTSYTPELANKLNITDYTDALWKHCLKEGKLTINYKTNLDVGHVYKQALRARQSKEQAVRTCRNVIANLENQIETAEKLNIYYSERPLGLDILLPESKRLEDFYMFIRDEKQLITGGVYIRSETTVRIAREQFINNCRISEKITEKNYQKILEKPKKQLKQVRKGM